MTLPLICLILLCLIPFTALMLVHGHVMYQIGRRYERALNQISKPAPSSPVQMPIDWIRAGAADYARRFEEGRRAASERENEAIKRQEEAE